MKVDFTFRNMEVSTALKDYVNEKLTRVKKLVPEPVEATIVLSVQRHNQLCEITIASEGKLYQGTESSEDMYFSIDKVMDKIQRQLRDSKQRRSQRP